MLDYLRPFLAILGISLLGKHDRRVGAHVCCIIFHDKTYVASSQIIYFVVQLIQDPIVCLTGPFPRMCGLLVVWL